MNKEFDFFLYNDFLSALLSGNRHKCSIMVKELLNKEVSNQEIYENVFKRAMYEIGNLWEYNKITVATEHLASAIVESLLNEVYLNSPFNESEEKSAVVCCVENEFHQIGAKMINDTLESSGWHSHFLGANTPIKDILNFINAVNPTIVAISMSLFFHLPQLECMIDQLNKKFPTLPILVGGQAFNHGGTENLLKYNNTIFISNTLEFQTFLNTYNYE